MVTIEKLYEMQEALDRYIEDGHGLSGRDLFEEKVLALLVEIGELANETRCFKFWSQKSASPRDVILEEFVDGVHFILSLGLLTNNRLEPEPAQSEATETKQFLSVMEAVYSLRQSRTAKEYADVLNRYFALGRMLGFSMDDVIEAYEKKNEVNYERQQSGY